MTTYEMGTHLTKSQIMSGTGDVKSSKVIGNNTVEYVRENGDRVIRHFTTDILTFKSDGTIIFNTNGHLNSTTKSRMNEYQKHVVIWTDKRVWYAATRPRVVFDKNDDRTVVYQDGMTWHPERGFENVT